MFRRCCKTLDMSSGTRLGAECSGTCSYVTAEVTKSMSVILTPLTRDLVIMLCLILMVHRKYGLFWQPDQNLTSRNGNRKKLWFETERRTTYTVIFLLACCVYKTFQALLSFHLAIVKAVLSCYVIENLMFY